MSAKPDSSCLCHAAAAVSYSAVAAAGAAQIVTDAIGELFSPEMPDKAPLPLLKRHRHLHTANWILMEMSGMGSTTGIRQLQTCVNRGFVICCIETIGVQGAAAL